MSADAEALIARRFDEWGFVPFVLREVFENPSPGVIVPAAAPRARSRR